MRQRSICFLKEISENWLYKSWASHPRAIPTDRGYKKVKRDIRTRKESWLERVIYCWVPSKGDEWEVLREGCFESVKYVLYGQRAKWFMRESVSSICRCKEGEPSKSSTTWARTFQYPWPSSCSGPGWPAGAGCHGAGGGGDQPQAGKQEETPSCQATHSRSWLGSQGLMFTQI